MSVVWGCECVCECSTCGRQTRAPDAPGDGVISRPESFHMGTGKRNGQGSVAGEVQDFNC